MREIFLPSSAPPICGAAPVLALCGGVAGAVSEVALTAKQSQENYSFECSRSSRDCSLTHPCGSELVLWQPLLLKFTMEKRENTAKKGEIVP